MRKKVVTGIMMLLLLLSMLTFAFSIRQVEASGTIYIRADGSVDPPSAPIQRDGDTYFLTDNIYDEIMVERNNIVVDGRSYTVQGVGEGEGIYLRAPADNVTIKNIQIKEFYYGIDVASSSNIIQGNNITNNAIGIQLYSTCNNIISGNNVTNNSGGIYLSDSSNNTVSGNDIRANSQRGIELTVSSSNNVLSGNNIVANNMDGIGLSVSSNYNMISGNSITANGDSGILVSWSSNYNSFFGNSMTNNECGIYLYETSNNTICHNNFVNNTEQVYSYNSINVWDDGYPSGGNYWSNYTGVDLCSGPYQNETGNDGIGDTSYIIDDNNVDHYPLMTMWAPNIPSRMVVAYPYEPSTLDPARCYDTTSVEPIRNVYETLIFFDEEKTNQFVPRLATEWSISPDGLTYTVIIRQGVKFHNNETLTTEDVEYSLERFLVIEGGPAWMFYEAFFDLFGSRDPEGNFIITGQQIDNAITRNDTTITLHLAKPYPPMMQILSQAWSSVLCKKWCVEIGDWPGTWNNWTIYNRPKRTAIEAQNAEPPGPRVNAMCGTGPFMLDYYRKGVEWSIIKFDNYWGGWPAPGSDGFLERVTSKKISDWETRKKLFLEGQLDCTQVPRTAIDEVFGQPGVRSIYPLEELSCYALFFTFNISVLSPYLGVPGGLAKGTFNESGIPPDFFTDINVRKGFAYAFNYSKLIEEGLRGEAYQPATPIIPGLPFYNPTQEKYSINLTKAAEHFAAAWNGQLVDNGFNFTICYPEGSFWQKKACEIIKANVESLSENFHIQIQPLPTPSKYISLARNHTLPMFLIGWLADYADPHNFAYAFMYSGGVLTQFQLYSNQTIDTFVREGVGTTNETARRQTYHELQRLYHEDCPGVPLCQTIQHRFERDWVQGWYYNPLFWMTNYFYVQWKGTMPTSARYSWPMFRHDLEHTGYSESPAPNTNQTQWKYTTRGYVGSSPAVADGRVYVASGEGDGRVYCLDAYTGAHIWNYTTGFGLWSSPAVADGRVYVGGGRVYCLDAYTGAHIWNYTASGGSSPAVANGRIYVGSGDGNVYCLDAYNGARIWNYSTGNEVTSSPAVVGGRVYVESYDGNVYCLDAYTGAHIWNYTIGDTGWSSPAVVDGRVYVGSYDGKVYSLDAYTGVPIWNYTTSGHVFSSPAIANGKVYVGSGDGNVYCLDAYAGARIWNYTTGREVHSSPAVADGKVYVGSYDHRVYCLDASTGELVWSFTTGHVVWSSPAVADGMLFIGSSDNSTYAFGNIVRVPEDYKTIEEAIDAADPGATVIIAPGIYHESIVINKTLTIVGGMGSAPIFSGGGSGIAITLLPDASGSTIAGIVITHWDQGIVIVNSTGCKIYDNIMSLMNYNGIVLEGTNAANNLIYSNIFQDNAIAINLTASSTSNTIYKNIISLSNIGLNLETNGNIIYANTIAENEVGITMSNSYDNIIYHNNFVNNTENARSEEYSNVWDNGYPSGGNYWSDYSGVDEKSGPNQNVSGSDGVGDTPYTVADNNIDRYPLVQPFNPHDIGITNVITSKTVVGQGFALCIDIKILNYGVYNETFTVTAYANTTIMATRTITLTRRNSTTITLTWNTIGFAKGNYTIKAVADTLPSETDTTDNTYTDNWVFITIPGDINSDKKVNILDAILLAKSFGSGPGTPNWNPNADLNNDNVVNILDAIILAGHFGEHEP